MARSLQLLAVMAVLAVHVCFAFSSYESEYNEWLYDVGMPSTRTGSVGKCKKDLLLVVDTSFSIGKSSFDHDVKPFLEKMILDPILNVEEGGTQIGLIIFSAARRTEILLNFGKIYDANQLVQFIKGLDWDRVSGGHTRTDLGLKLANEIFSAKNPSNNRPGVDDVVVIITDGEPRGRRNTLQMTKQYANDLKEKGVLVVAAAVGPDRKNFRHILDELATSTNYVLEADFTQMDGILAKLVASSCIKPGKCTCHEMTSSPIYIQPGQSTARVEWPIPQFTCKAGRKATVKAMEVTPQITSPHSFSIGEHVINYTFRLKGGVTVTCPVIITVKGELCRGKVFNSREQVCCCGSIHQRKPGHECCGPDYYNSYNQKCCENANLISNEDSCPSH